MRVLFRPPHPLLLAVCLFQGILSCRSRRTSYFNMLELQLLPESYSLPWEQMRSEMTFLAPLLMTRWTWTTVCQQHANPLPAPYHLLLTLLVPLPPMVSHQAASSPPALAPRYSVPVATSTNVSPSLANEGNDLSGTTIDDVMELDNNLNSTGSPAHGALKPSMHPSLASVPLPPGVNNQVTSQP